MTRSSSLSKSNGSPLKSTIAATYEFGKCICAQACAVISKSQSIRCFLLLPRIGNIFANLVEGKHFSKLDLRQAYHQVEVSEESNNNLAITTHKRLVFDITSNPSIWQRAFNLAPSPSSMIWLLRTKPIKSIWKIQRTCSSDAKRGFEGQPKGKSFSRIE